MKLYELVGKDKTQGFSPYVWRARMALAHKGLKVEMVPLTFSEIPELTGANAKTVPILEYDGGFITDSWDIAIFLEENFSDKPSLFGGNAGKAYANFFNFVSFYNLIVPLFQTLVYDIFNELNESDRDYFRASREARLGKSLEEAHENQLQNLDIFRKQLWPYNMTLKSQEFLSGDEPAYVDYIMYGLFQWAKGVSAIEIVNEDDQLYRWRAKMDDLYDGLGQVIKTRA
ncbi:MAG: glutathione S-transferase N-terminal domain-containing protein [Emcibacter sp.]|nr:glutathione S-transferase N-terminal domain-containing protein [Emcibacter sp.]